MKNWGLRSDWVAKVIKLKPPAGVGLIRYLEGRAATKGQATGDGSRRKKATGS